MQCGDDGVASQIRQRVQFNSRNKGLTCGVEMMAWRAKSVIG